MTKELIIDILIAICIAGVTLAGILYFLSYDSYDKDVDRRLKESERKKRKREVKSVSIHRGYQAA